MKVKDVIELYGMMIKIQQAIEFWLQEFNDSEFVLDIIDGLQEDLSGRRVELRKVINNGIELERLNR